MAKAIKHPPAKTAKQAASKSTRKPKVPADLSSAILSEKSLSEGWEEPKTDTSEPATNVPFSINDVPTHTAQAPINTGYLSPIILMLIAVLFWGCTTEKKAAGYFANHKDALAPICANAFPIIETSITKTDTLYKSDNIDYSEWADSLDRLITASVQRQQADSIQASLSQKDCEGVVERLAREKRELQAQISAFNYTYKPCKPDTLRTTVTITKRDSAGSYVKDIAQRDCENQVLLLQAKCEREHKWRMKFMWLFFVLLGAGGLYAFLRIKKVFTF